MFRIYFLVNSQWQSTVMTSAGLPASATSSYVSAAANTSSDYINALSNPTFSSSIFTPVSGQFATDQPITNNATLIAAVSSTTLSTTAASVFSGATWPTPTTTQTTTPTTTQTTNISSVSTQNTPFTLQPSSASTTFNSSSFNGAAFVSASEPVATSLPSNSGDKRQPLLALLVIPGVIIVVVVIVLIVVLYRRHKAEKKLQVG
jgi:hypothetical protein